MCIYTDTLSTVFIISKHRCDNQSYSEELSLTFCVNSSEANFKTKRWTWEWGLGTVSKFDSSFIRSSEFWTWEKKDSFFNKPVCFRIYETFPRKNLWIWFELWGKREILSWCTFNLSITIHVIQFSFRKFMAEQAKMWLLSSGNIKDSNNYWKIKVHIYIKSLIQRHS